MAVHCCLFEVIIEQTLAREHDVALLTPDSPDRSSESGDWPKREIEVAMEHRRRVVPLLVTSLSFVKWARRRKRADSLARLKA